MLNFTKVLAPEDRVDFETGMLILQVLKTILEKKVGFRKQDLKFAIVPSKRCPIIKLDFEQCCPELRQLVAQNSNADPTRPGRPLAFNKVSCFFQKITGNCVCQLQVDVIFNQSPFFLFFSKVRHFCYHSVWCVQFKYAQVFDHS